MPTAIVRPPSPRLTDGEVTYHDRQRVDSAVAYEQWRRYVTCLSDAGFDCVELPAADDHPDGVFVEDTVVIVGDTAILTSPGAASRSGEVASTRRFLSERGMPLAEIAAPGHLDGGDVLKVGTTIYVGRSSRTDEEGIRQFTGLAEALGYTVVAVPVAGALHLKTTLTALPDGAIIGYEPLVADRSPFDVFIPVPDPLGASVLILDDDRVLMSDSAPATAQLLADRGLGVVTVPITEFEKVEGGVTCLSVRIR